MSKQFLLISMSIYSLSFAYDVGDYVNIAHQNTDFEICYAPELDPNNDGMFNFSEYNGDGLINILDIVQIINYILS